jgi:hypothetical protein
MREYFRSKIQFNKQIIFRLITIFLISQILFCASAKRYVVNRGNDLTDIVNVGVEKDVYGFDAIFLIPIGGVTRNANGKGLGLRHSHLGFYKTGDNENVFLIKDKNLIVRHELHLGDSIFYGTGFHEPINPRNLRTQNKNYLILTRGKGCYDTKLYYKEEARLCHWTTNIVFFPIEISLGIYFGIRVGFNVGEFADFIVGFVGFDPIKDDYDDNGNLPEMKDWKEKNVITIIRFYEKDLPKPLEKKDWESKLDAIDEKMNMRLIKK